MHVTAVTASFSSSSFVFIACVCVYLRDLINGGKLSLARSDGETMAGMC